MYNNNNTTTATATTTIIIIHNKVGFSLILSCAFAKVPELKDGLSRESNVLIKT